MNILRARRLDDVGEYYFSVKLRELAELSRKGVEIVSLAIGGPDMAPPAAAAAAAAGCLRRSDSHGYQPSSATPDLRQAFADWYARWYGVNLSPDSEILPLVGSKEAVFLISMALLNPGDCVLVPDPGYPTYTSATRLAGAEVVKYQLTEEGGWLPDFDALEASDLEGVKMMWTTYPHMPTGTPASPELFRRLVDFGRRHNILIVNDNPYSFILNPRPLSILQTPGASECCVELNSLSKCLNMPGWRVGVLAGRPDVVSWVLAVKSNLDSGQPLAIMEGAVAALSSPREWYENLNDRYRKRQRIASRIMDVLGCSCRQGQQGLFLWGRIPDSWKSAEALSDAVLEGARVFVTPGFIFGSQGERYVRISLCAPEERLEEALRRIIEWRENNVNKK